MVIDHSFGRDRLIMPFDNLSATVAPSIPGSAFSAYDRSLHGMLAELTGGVSPVLAAGAWFDWISHLALSPGKQLDLCLQAAAALQQMGDRPSGDAVALHPGSRFAGDAWRVWPYGLLHQSHSACEAWWRSATTGVRGVGAHHERLMQAKVRQVFDALSPANFLATNPDLQRQTLAQGGQNLIEGVKNFAADHTGTRPSANSDFAVGRNLALTSGKVVFRNALIELIQYQPATPKVHPQPVLIVPAWIMKYYILDLQPQNSMIRFLVERGHTVFAISWRNPTAEDYDLGMEDYRRRGVMAAIDAIDDCLPASKVHAVGYCLGGTMLAIAGAAMARDGDDRLASISLFAAQTDFTEPGDLKLFINDTQLAWLEDLMAQRGGLDGNRMGAAFQMLRADELIWGPFVRRYVLGETDHPNDLMAWNADQTRMPYRMHAEYLASLFLRNELASGHFVIDGRPIALRDIRVPIFALGTAKDHVAPWRSVYKISLLSRTDVTFVLASGGHNAGVISEPGHKGRSYQRLVLPADALYVDPEAYLQRAAHRDGSWWPEWQQWLADRSADPVAPPKMKQTLCDAPGTYVLAS
jgi:polyhydroxyalkanoate synthase subunit PhaC